MFGEISFDLPWSLRTCHKLLTDFDRVSCTGGVFMQNLDTTMGTSRYLRAKDPLYPCTAVPERDKVYCYLMVTSRILTLDGYNWRKAAAWCRKSEPGWVKLERTGTWAEFSILSRGMSKDASVRIEDRIVRAVAANAS